MTRNSPMLIRHCKRCEGKGRVYAHDPARDGHGGLNGGSWGWFQCGECQGTGKSKAELRADWPLKYTILVCTSCGAQREKGYKECRKAGGKCSTQGHPIKLKVYPPCPSCGEPCKGRCEDCEAAR